MIIRGESSGEDSQNRQIMNDKDKIQLANALLSLVGQYASATAGACDTPLRQIGVLTKAQGIRGFKTCEPGTPVFEYDGRYVLVMETLDGKHSASVAYYQEALAPVVARGEALT